MVSKEDIEILVQSEYWGQVREEMDEKRQDLVDTLVSMDFTAEKALLQAITIQSEIKSIDTLMDSISNVQENAE